MRLLLCILAVVMVASGCGSDQAATDSTTTPSTAATLAETTTTAVVTPEPELGVPVARQRPWEDGEDRILHSELLARPGVIEFREPGCMVYTRDEDGAEFAVLMTPGTTYRDGYTQVPDEDDSIFEWPVGVFYGTTTVYRLGDIENWSIVDPATPLREFCPGFDEWIIPDSRGE